MFRAENEYNRQILQAIASGGRVTQRALAGNIGVALGLTNLLVRRLVAKGYVRVTGIGPRHVRYLMTSAGWEALACATRQSLENTVHLYTQTREQNRASLSSVSERCPVDQNGRKLVLFYGAGDAAEIAFVGLQRTDLTLAGVIDDYRTGMFFGVQIYHSSELSQTEVAGVPYARIVVTTLRHSDAISARLKSLSVSDSKVSYL